MSNTDGGPAFPVVESDLLRGTRVSGGMSLRDYFAGQAVANLLSFPPPESMNVGDYWEFSHVADESYKIADAMLKARGDVIK
mgnify:CR=1 FL=1